jgi:hypothetical protein
VKISFVIDGSVKGRPLHAIEAELLKHKISNKNLVENQVGRLDYAVVELDDRTKDMIDELKVESLRREELERKIAEVSERTKKRASNMMRMARKNHAEVKSQVDRVRNQLEDVETERSELENELNEYVEVRDKCVSVKILNELMSKNEIALRDRILSIKNRCDVLRSTGMETEKALEIAKEEKEKVASEMGMSTEELQVAVMTARAETDRELERIEEMEKETLQCHKEYSANTRKQVSALKAEALRAHASMVSSTEKQKLKILYVVFERLCSSAKRENSLSHVFTRMTIVSLLIICITHLHQKKITRTRNAQMHTQMLRKTLTPTLERRYLSKELATKERSARSMNMKKEKLVRDFSILRQAFEMHSSSVRCFFYCHLILSLSLTNTNKHNTNATGPEKIQR